MSYKLKIFYLCNVSISSDAPQSSATTPSPELPLSSPSSPLFVISPFPSPSTAEPAGKKQKFNFKEIVVDSLGNISSKVEKLLSEENERISIELEKKVDILSEIAQDNKKNKQRFNFFFK